MIEKVCDLHVHSSCSDGTDSPEEVVCIAEKAGLSAVALCDHNTVAGLTRFINAAENSRIIAVPGIEITCQYNSKEVHILGLFLKADKFKDVAEYVVEINIRKTESNEILIERLNNAGYIIDYQEVLTEAKGAIPNRAHFANVLVRKGYVSNSKIAFATLLSPDKGFYTEAKKLDAIDVVAFLHSIGAMPIMAHPLYNLSYDELTSFLPKAKKMGLVGMECIYPLFDEAQTKQAYELADMFGLNVSGGSDYHGANKSDTKIGVGKNNIKVPFSVFEELQSKA